MGNGETNELMIWGYGSVTWDGDGLVMILP